MALKCNNMPGIVEVRWIKMNKLSPNMEAKALAGLPLAVLEDSNIITLFRDATLSHGWLGKPTGSGGSSAPLSIHHRRSKSTKAQVRRTANRL